MSIIVMQFVFIGWALTYCLVYLLARFINEKYKWAGMVSVGIGFLIPFIYMMLCLLMIINTGVENGAGFLMIAGVVGIIGAQVALKRKKRTLIYACGSVFILQILFLCFGMSS